MILEKFLEQHRKIGLDTSVFIFQVDENPRYIHLTHRVFEWLQSSRNAGVTSTITMLEVLVQPYREAEDERIDNFYALLSTYPHLTWIETNLEIADRAAQLRTRFNLRTPDAIQAATAIAGNATGFISNDPAFRRIPDFEVIILDDLLKSS